ncbi:DUF5060 domain-containing protein [Terriglobus roseus]|uniref:Tat (Twin-arginine translocation) pathway signal sequence n=1 Tax=Terriglobus roseus TaxID=392734 RepID=A0A1H4NB14_9BACT|nr:DUF5060 domain-containing protein [Terriglobus roseus]SEB92287.1 Tat (twin-arginine translocation) pathway signal sequence [Terriglobus roseus]
MKNLSRRDALKLSGAAAAALLPAALPAQPTGATQHASVPVWEIFELTVNGPGESAGSNPWNLRWSVIFAQENRRVTVDGFYDGDGVFKARFMPDAKGLWTYTTESETAQLRGHAGRFHAIDAKTGAHGPVAVHNTQHFSYADGSPYFPFGTTSYAWIHEPEALQQQTLATLKAAPFNKIRMCVFPKHYEYNHNEPEFYPFPRSGSINDYTRFDPRFFAHLERRILDLQAMGIEADLILFHPYDRWGYQSMSAETDAFYLRYLVARLGAYRNVWWSLANEWDLMKSKSLADFDRLFHVLESADAHGHLCSIHYSVTMYDYARPWVTHASLQTDEFEKAPGWLAAWKKPVVFDECKYEGNLNKRWGNISAAEMLRRFWLGVINGCYVTHGETYLPETDAAFNEDTTPTLWWAHGGALHGESSAGIAQLRKVAEESAPKPSSRMGFDAPVNPYYLNAVAYAPDGKTAETILYYMDSHQPVWYEFPLPEAPYTAELIDPSTGTITKVAGTYHGKLAKLRLKVKPFQAVRFRLAHAGMA